MNSTHTHSAALGDLIAAVFDAAAEYSTDPREVSRLAVRSLGHLLRETRKVPIQRTRLVVETMAGAVS